MGYCISKHWSSLMFCKFPAVSSNVLDVISILVSEIVVMFNVQFNFSLFPAHINISYSNNNVYILCRKRGGQKTMLMDVRPLTITSKLKVK